MVCYENIVFLQGDDAGEILDILDVFGESSAMEHLQQYDYGESQIESRDDFPWGSRDMIYREGNYVMSYNIGLGYIGLIKITKPE